MGIKEGIKDFLVGVLVITLFGILSILLIILWPLINAIGWLAIILLVLAIAILLTIILIMIIGQSVRRAYRKK